MQGGGFHPRNPMDFTHEIWQISPRYHLWNPPKIIKASVLAKTLQFDECRVGDFTLEIWWISPWNLVDFTQIWPVKSTQNYKSKCFSKNSSVWWMQGGGYDQGFHEIHMKSGGFHVKSAGFHEICRISPEIRRISREIRRISREIRRISCEIERPLARNCNPMFFKSKHYSYPQSRIIHMNMFWW